MFGLLPSILGYAQMALGPEIIDSGIKRTEFKARPLYIPTWVVDSIVSFTSRIAGGDQGTIMHFAEGILPGLHHHPLSRWLARFNVVDVAKPFSKEHLEPLEGKHEILALPYTTTPLAIPEALAECPYDDIEVAEGWNVDPKSVEFKMLAAYPILQPVYLAEFEMGDRHITALAHGHYDYFAIWGHENHPDTWVNNSPAGIVITYLRTLAMDLKGGPPAMTELITDSCSPENLEKIVREVDMNDLRIQPVSSANITRRWMELAGKADGMRFIIDQPGAHEQAWEKLSSAIQQIYAKNASSLSFEENYRHAYNLVVSKHGEMLYQGLTTLVTNNLNRLVKEKLVPEFPRATLDGRDAVGMCQEGEAFVKAFRDVWDDHESSMSKISDLVKYMDRVYTDSARVPKIMDRGLELFLSEIIRSTQAPIRTQLITSESTVYKMYLEPEILKESETYYSSRGKEMLEGHDLAEYIRLVEVYINAEQDRTHSYLSYHTSTPLQDILVSYLLTPYTSRLLSGSDAHTASSIIDAKPHTALDLLIDAERTDDLARILRIFLLPAEEEGIKVLRRQMKDGIINRGKAINEECDEGGAAPAPNTGARKQQSQLWMTNVLALKDLYDRLLKHAWGGEVSLQTAINEAFETFINQNKRASEFISLFIDDHLKKGMKGKTEEEVDTLIDRTISVFRFISDKDVFERYYKAHLAKRLLQSRIECGFAFTQKLEGMFHDIRLSADLTDSFRAFVQRVADDDEAATPIDMHTSVLTSTFWPITHTTNLSNCIMPPVIAKAMANFERFYYARHTGRRLAWQPGYGSADIKVAFKTRKHELNVSTLAMVVLLAFNDTDIGEELEYQEIQKATGIPDQELQRHLQSLACAKYKILRKHPATRNVSRSDTFSFNYDFTAPLQRIKIQTVASKAETTEERRETEEKVEEERKLQTEACIVRVMKDRKHMSHNDLISEVTKQLSNRFHPIPAAIKKRIEALIEKEYLERGEDKKSYNYLA
ncbi:cullin family [Ceratobasidium sp. AG-Ba]|nr:cullin family [Ceratobasidium sp. AG-Ba]